MKSSVSVICLSVDAEVVIVAYSWGAVFAFTSILSVLLAFSVCLIKKPNSCKSSGIWYHFNITDYLCIF